MATKQNIPVKIFLQKNEESFGAIFPFKLISTLSNMLAIDFSLHNNEDTEDAEIKAATYVKNIKEYLSISDQKFDNSFASATILFSVALSPPQNADNSNLISQIQEKEEIVDTYIATYISDLSHNEISSARDAITLLLEFVDSDQLLNFIKNDPKILITINSKYIAQMNKVRAQLIANEIAETYKIRRHNIDTSLKHITNMQSLINDLAKHTSSEEYQKPKVTISGKGTLLQRRT